jgi:hypothetical protein
VNDRFFPETSVTKYPSTLRNITEEQRSRNNICLFWETNAKQTNTLRTIGAEECNVMQAVRDGTNKLSNVKVNDGVGGG